MSQPLSIIRDINGYPTTGEFQCLVFTNTAQYFTLTANSVTTVTVPAGNYSRLMANIKAAVAAEDPLVWVLPAASPTLTLPSGTVAATLAELNPGCKVVVPGQVLQFLTSQTGVNVSITYYVLPS